MDLDWNQDFTFVLIFFEDDSVFPDRSSDRMPILLARSSSTIRDSVLKFPYSVLQESYYIKRSSAHILPKAISLLFAYLTLICFISTVNSSNCLIIDYINRTITNSLYIDIRIVSQTKSRINFPQKSDQTYNRQSYFLHGCRYSNNERSLPSRSLPFCKIHFDG
mgnify:CR=1 FL=1